MKKAVKASAISFDDITLSINGNKKQGCFVVILERTKEQMDAMLSHHCQVLIVRLDLHISSYTPDNTLMSKYIRKVRKKLRTQYGFSRMGFIWAREQERAKHQHYHLALFVDANKVRHPAKLISTCEGLAKAWELFLFTPPNCYYLLKRGDGAQYQKAYRRLSYLAKTRGKGYKAKCANDYSSSRLKTKVA